MINYFDEYVEVNYFTLQEAYTRVKESFNPYNLDFKDISLFTASSPLTFNYDDNNLSIINKLHNIVFSDNRKKYIIVLGNNKIDDASIQDAFNNWLISYNSLINKTASRYLTLIKLLNEKESSLLAQIKTSSTGTSRYNDTPQSSDFQEIEGTDYATNITKTSGETTSDGGTTMARLEEVRQNLRNLYTDWAEEFRQLFIEERNITE